MSERQEVGPELAHVWTARLVGWLCVLAFFGISTIFGGFEIAFWPPFTRIAQGEANIWLSSAYFLFPASFLLGYGHHGWISRRLSWLRKEVGALKPRELRWATVCLTALAVSSARVFNHVVLLGYPITDDEWAVRFGGEALAAGKLLVRLPFLSDCFPTLFMFVDKGWITSIDWLGAQLPWAISTLTHTGNWVFALAAAVPVPCMMWLLAKRLGPSWSLAGAALFMVSPMAFSLSLSTHAHLASRAWIALALALHVHALDRERSVHSFAQGFALGMAIISRPFETCFLLAPLYCAETWRTLRQGDRAALLRWLWFALGVAIPLAIFFLHTYATTGGLRPPRHHQNAIAAPITELSYWVRFGSNSAYNALRLAVYFAGPLGVLLFAAGVLTNRFTALLSLGVLSVLGLGLFHDNYGVHLVGPIHYSECAVPLTLVAVHGLHRITRAWRRVGIAPDLPLAVTAVWLLIGLGTFDALHAHALHEQALIQVRVYERIESEIPLQERPAVLFAPSFGESWRDIPPFRARGSWVFEWRRPRPDFKDDILILHGSMRAYGTVRTAFPERKFFFLHRDGPDKWFRITTDMND